MLKYIRVILAALVLIIFCAKYFLLIIQVHSTSMKPSLKKNQYLLLKRIHNSSQNLYQRGQLILFNHPQKENVLKRIIGLPGDTLIYHNKEIYLKKLSDYSIVKIKNIYISHGKVDEGGYPLTVYQNMLDGITFTIAITDIVPQNEMHFFQQKNMPVAQWVVPEKSLFVMGDNRDNSMDSRYLGFVKFEDTKAVEIK